MICTAFKKNPKIYSLSFVSISSLSYCFHDFGIIFHNNKLNMVDDMSRLNLNRIGPLGVKRLVKVLSGYRALDSLKFVLLLCFSHFCNYFSYIYSFNIFNLIIVSMVILFVMKESNTWQLCFLMTAI